MEITAFIINAICTLLLARYSLDFNPDLRQKVESLDSFVSTAIEKLKTGEAVPALDVTAGFFGFIALAHFALFIFSALLSIKSQVWLIYVTSIFLYATIVWMAIKWFTSYKRFSFKFLKDMSIFCLYTLSIPAMDYLTGGTGITELMLNQMLQLPQAIGIEISGTGIIWKDGLIISALFELIILSYWLTTSLIFLPIALSSLFIVSGTILIAKLLSRISPNRPLSPLCFLIWLITAPYGWF